MNKESYNGGVFVEPREVVDTPQQDLKQGLDYATFNNIIAPVEFGDKQKELPFVRWVKKGTFVCLECLTKVGETTTYKEVPMVFNPQYGMIDIPMDQIKFPQLLR